MFEEAGRDTSDVVGRDRRVRVGQVELVADSCLAGLKGLPQSSQFPRCRKKVEKGEVRIGEAEE